MFEHIKSFRFLRINNNLIVETIYTKNAFCQQNILYNELNAKLQNVVMEN